MQPLRGIQRDDDKDGTGSCNWAVHLTFHSCMHRYSFLLPATEISHRIGIGAGVNEELAEHMPDSLNGLSTELLEYCTHAKQA